MGSELRRLARVCRARPVEDESPGSDCLELSVTIGYLGADVKVEEINLLQSLLQESCVSGLVLMERGEMESHLHFQMVCRARCKSARSFGILTRKAMGWYDKRNMVPASKVTCKVLTNRMLHTYTGMIGYCLKDDDKEHFQHVMHNVTDEEVNAGRNLHSLYGRADLKSRVTLTNKNISERMYVWRKYKCQRPMHATFLLTLTEMIQSGMFIPAASWIIPFGGQGMNLRRMAALWKCIMEPNAVTKDDVLDVFVQRKEYVKGRYFSGDVNDPTVHNTLNDEEVAPGTPMKKPSLSPINGDPKGKRVRFEEPKALPAFTEFIPLQTGATSVFSNFLHTNEVLSPSILNAGEGGVERNAGEGGVERKTVVKLEPGVEWKTVVKCEPTGIPVAQFVELSSDSDEELHCVGIKSAPVSVQRTGGPSKPPVYRRHYHQFSRF